MTEVVLTYWELGGIIACLLFAGHASTRFQL